MEKKSPRTQKSKSKDSKNGKPKRSLYQRLMFAYMKKYHMPLYEWMYKSKFVQNALNVGDKIPLDVFEDCLGQKLKVSELLEKGPIVIKFFRGFWCPLCVEESEEFSSSHLLFEELGATTLAITTQHQEFSANFMRRTQSNFYLIADPYRTVAKEFNLALEMKGKYKKFIQKKEFYLEDTNQIYVPATYVIDHTGTIVFAHIAEDFSVRPEINLILQYVKKAKMDNEKRKTRVEEPFRNSLVNIHVEIEKAVATKRKKGGLDPLYYCISNEEFFNSFRSFLEKSLCIENLIFLMEVADYVTGFQGMDSNKKKSEVERLYETYIQEMSPLQINIEDNTRTQIETRVKDQDITEEIFRDAAQEVHELLLSDSVHKWKKTKEFYGVWIKNGSPEVLNPQPEFLR